MASLRRDEWKTAADAEQIEMEMAKAVVQARNYLSKIM
jgi:hypothetical protein